MKKRIVILLMLMVSCSSPVIKQTSIDPTHKLESHPLIIEHSVIERVTVPSGRILAYLRRLDNRPDYQPYRLSQGERSLVRKAIANLPRGLRRIMDNRCAGIYFLKDFMSAGMTDWIVDDNGRVFFYMVYNKKVLSLSTSQILSYRENSAFQRDSSHSLGLKVTPEIPGFTYILLHESLHSYDYVHGVTPFVEPGLNLGNNRKIRKPYEPSMWTGYGVTRTSYSFRKDISFYGFRKPALSSRDMMTIYNSFMKTPFMTLYGSLNWAEDAAEVMAFYHMTQKMKRDYSITLYDKGKPVKSWNFIDSQEKLKRFTGLENFYR
jgi:hypothetical protein